MKDTELCRLRCELAAEMGGLIGEALRERDAALARTIGKGVVAALSDTVIPALQDLQRRVRALENHQ